MSKELYEKLLYSKSISGTFGLSPEELPSCKADKSERGDFDPHIINDDNDSSTMNANRIESHIRGGGCNES